MSLVFVDCEFSGPCPGIGDLTEFGAVMYPSKDTFHGILKGDTPYGRVLTFWYFSEWLRIKCKSRPIFVSDNPAADWQWINFYFHHLLGFNPFGWSARRIGDYYAGLKGNFSRSTDWKRLRDTKHDHNPVNDAMGNVEAFIKMQEKLKEKLNREKILKEFDDIFISDHPMEGGTMNYEIKGDVYNGKSI